MKSERSTAGRPGRSGTWGCVLTVFVAAFLRVSTGQEVDRNLRVNIVPARPNVVLSWFGSNAAPYQLESSTTLTNWVDASLVLTGRGTLLFATNPIGRLNRNFYRVKRLTPSTRVTAVFNPATGVLTITGDALDNLIEVSRNAAGAILVNRGATDIQGGTPTVANTVLIQIFGRDGQDTLALDESNGALPKAEIFGENGDDTLTGGSGGDTLNGGPGHDTLAGRGGPDLLLGGPDNDTLTGGDADDQVFGEAGTDRLIWNPGDDTDLNEGGEGIDTVEVNGGNGTENFTTTANGTRVRFDRLDPAPFSIDIGTSEQLVLRCNGGDDTASATGNLAALIQLTYDGGPGNDRLLGGNGPDLLLGGDGNDFVDGQQGNDSVSLGAGDDVFQWDPGDGSDTVEGQDGADRVLFNGSAANEIFELAANGNAVRFTRNLGAIVLDLKSIEAFDLNPLAGADNVVVRSLAATDLTAVNIDLAGLIGGTTGDGAADTITVLGSESLDAIDVFGAGTATSVLGLAARVNLTNTEGANDSLTVNALGGNDEVTATTLPAGVIKLVVDGGPGNDTLLGSQGADTFFGGDGDDVITGDNGDDVAFLGADNDRFEWSPGDGNDTVEGQDGADTLRFFGANVSENIDLTANGGRVLFVRNVANIAMDLNDVETVDVRALGGADNIVVGDLTGTDLTTVALDLRSSGGSADGAADTVTINGSPTDDVFSVTGDATGVSVAGLHTVVNIAGAEPANDRLTLNGLAGDDVLNASALNANLLLLVMNGGLGADVFIGSPGDDLISGGDGNDTALMGAGQDTYVWNPGDDNDTIEGQSGTDTLLFNGANISEIINIAANGGRVVFTRNVASVILDLNDTEIITFNALGGADLITVNSVSGTDLTTINVDLAGTVGGAVGDGAADMVTLNGTATVDTFNVTANAGLVSIASATLGPAVRILHPEVANDLLVLNGLGGVDLFNVGAGVNTLIGVTINQ